MTLIKDHDPLAPVIAHADLVPLPLHPHDDVADAGPVGEPGVEEAELVTVVRL
jgi:hypothetical protein